VISEARLSQLLSSLARTIRQRGIFFRSIDVEYLMNGTPLSAIGSIVHGGRYNRIGDFEALYLADTQETALFETAAIFRVKGITIGAPQPPRAMLSLKLAISSSLGRWLSQWVAPF
jgi:hypothetical protein